MGKTARGSEMSLKDSGAEEGLGLSAGQALGEWWHHQALMSAMDCSMLATGWLWRWQEPGGEL